uniref:Cation channel sperm associated 3 n=1 Tax=Ursus americanus TaxID=9643 RepID=A0A452RSM9_URSAM
MSQQFHFQNDTRVISSSLLDNPSVAFCARFGKFQRRDSQCQAFVKRVIMSRLFKIIMISIVSLNAFFVVLWTDYNTKYNLFRLFEVSELVFVSIYSSEFCMKLYVDPINYWKDGYNLLDVIIIITIFIPYGLRRFKGKHYLYLNIADGMQSLRILKLITYSRGIRCLWPCRHSFTAVGQTAYIVASVLSCCSSSCSSSLILGFCLWSSRQGYTNNWGTWPALRAGIWHTWPCVQQVDGWTTLQDGTFTIIVHPCLPSFVSPSAVRGVMIIHTEDSIKKFERELMAERHVTLMEEKQVILKRQQEEVSKLMQMQKNANYRSFSELVENFKKTLRHTDPMVLDDFGTSLPFIDVYLSTLDNQDTTIYKLQELYYEIAHVLSLMLEDLPQKKPSQSSEKADEK